MVYIVIPVSYVFRYFRVITFFCYSAFFSKKTCTLCARPNNIQSGRVKNI